MVELRAAEVDAADQRADRAVLRIERQERRLDFRQLDDLPALAFALHAHDRAAADPLLLRGLRVERARGEAQSVAGDHDLLAGAQARLDLLRIGREHDRREEIVAIGVVGERVVVLVFRCIGAQLVEAFGAAIPLAPVVLERPLSHRLVRRFLIAFSQRRVDAEAAGIDVFRIVFR